MSDLKRLINSRKFIRRCITEHYNRRLSFDTCSSFDRSKLKLQFEQWNSEIKTLNEQILALKCDEWGEEEEEKMFNDEFKVCQEYSDKLLSCLVSIKDSGEGAHSAASRSLVEEASGSARSLLKSPIAPLPKYGSSDSEDLVRFIDEFEDTIGKFNYPEYDKLLLLKQQISGRALILVNSLEADKQGYGFAKELLLKAFASDDTQKFSVLRQLSQLELNLTTDPYEYISKIRLIRERLRKLEIDIDTVVQFFIWEGLNDIFKTHLIQITNNSKPSLSEITDNYFKACDRYQGQYKLSKCKSSVPSTALMSVENAATNMAININPDKDNSFKPCSICTKIDGKSAAHPIFKCPKFDSAKSKVDKLKLYNGCVKCSNLNHESKSCRYRFRSRCKYCSDWHFSFLCCKEVNSVNLPNRTDKPFQPNKETSQTNAKTKDKSGKVISGCVVNVTEAFHCDPDVECILPTFTCKLENKIRIRCLKDSGCQSNFISTSMANSLHLKTVKDNISLTINGINTSQRYLTRLVEVSIDIGGNVRQIHALCLPTINISLKLPRLGEVVQGFIDRGYVLADESLTSNDCEIGCLDFILGTRSGYCLPHSEHLFGADLMSLYSMTPAGVLLQGSIGQILLDIPYLPLVRTCSSGSIQTLTPTLLENLLPTRNTCLMSDFTIDESLVPSNFSVLNDRGEVIESMLEKATAQVLEDNCSHYINVDSSRVSLNNSEVNAKLVKFALDNMTRANDGRIIVPLLWNTKVAHLLGTNQGLARTILSSNLKKLLKNREHLLLMDRVFKEQERTGILEKIYDLDNYLAEHPNHSFLPHMGVFNLNRETTKCRVVYLSNLCQQDPNKNVTVSHNQAIFPGPNLNQKLASSLLHLRFGSELLCFDICKAFNNLALNEVDSNRLLCLWYRNVEKGDFTIVGYRNVRLSFGLRCSPTLLLLALYKILVLDVDGNNKKLIDLKMLLFQLTYMDNIAVAFDDGETLKWAYHQLEGIFEPYMFNLQQFVTNNLPLQASIDSELKIKTDTKVKLLGLSWDREKDTLSTRPIQLDVGAKTKRTILSSIASQYDLYNFNGPILNRSRLFLHELQCNKDLGWDKTLDDDLQRQWRNIAKQANASPAIELPRFVGSRNDSYRLLAFSDSSKVMFGVVIYIQNISNGHMNFVIAKNRIVNKQLELKSIPSLELQGVALAVECLLDLYDELSGSGCLKPINIVDLQVFSDSLVVLSWIHSYSVKLGKLQKCSVFVNNRLHNINELCDRHPITFSFISGEQNPGDCITRSLSHKQLLKTNYLSGPKFLLKNNNPELSKEGILVFVVPDPNLGKGPSTEVTESLGATISPKDVDNEHLLVVSRVPTFHRLISTYKRVLIFVNCLKCKIKAKYPDKYNHLNVYDSNHNFFAEASKLVLMHEQRYHFPEIFEYFDSSKRLLKDVPRLVGQLNVYIDSEGLLRVRSKLSRLKEYVSYRFPLLLSKDSILTKLIISDYHWRFAHAGCYALLSEIRKKFWIPRYFSTVKKVLKSCITCRRFNERALKLNQNSYRDFRVNPPEIPFRNIFLDYIGPYFVSSNGRKVKVWILCITCTWSRAVNLKLCIDLSVKEFLRSFQIHCFEFGLPELCVSDLGSQLVAGANIILDFLKDPEVKLYFNESGIKPIQFEHFFKGHSELGSMVESCVKLTKRLLFGSIRNNVLDIRDFEFFVFQTIHLINRRPIAFKETLRETDLDESFPDPITPETLIHGYDLVSINVIPELQRTPHLEDLDYSVEPSVRIRDNYVNLRKVRSRLIDLYHSEFLANLTQQAVCVKDRYKPVKHTALKKNDIVLIKEPYSKPAQYPMGIVRNVIHNDLGEVTGAVLLKGKTRDLTKRHVSNLIFLLRPATFPTSETIIPEVLSPHEDVSPAASVRGRRKASKVSKLKTRKMFQDNTC